MTYVRRTAISFALVATAFATSFGAKACELEDASRLPDAEQRERSNLQIRDAADTKLVEQKRNELLRHIADAKNIVVEKSDTAFNWKINWRNQQSYCLEMKQEIFKKKTIAFPEPIFSSNHGTLNQLRHLIERKISPLSCDHLILQMAHSEKKISPDSILGTKIEARGWHGYTFRVYERREKEKLSFVAEYLNPDAKSRIKIDSAYALIPESPIMLSGFSLQTGGGRQGKKDAMRIPASCYPNDPFEAVGYPADRSDSQGVVLVEIKGKLVALEFGTYSNQRFAGYEEMYFSKPIGDGSMKGRSGQGYVLLKESGKNFASAWASTSPGENFAGYDQPIDLHSKEDIFSYSCVFNFDKR